MIEKLCPKCGRHYKSYTASDSVKCYHCQIVISADGQATKMGPIDGYAEKPRFYIYHKQHYKDIKRSENKLRDAGFYDVKPNRKRK